MDAFGLCDVAGNPRLCRNGPDISPGIKSNALAVGRYRRGINEFTCVFQLVPACDEVVRNVYGHFAVFLGGQVEHIKESAVLEHYRIIAKRRELDVEFLEICEFLRFLCFKVIYEEVHCAVAVGCEIDLIAGPHGKYILGGIVRDVLGLFCFKIVDPDIIGHASAVIFPGTEFPENAVVGKF